ncbi:MAG: hypothetical protein OXG04_09145 [Acidobacteria bacterium]|nr:hypothetical protein [Acidobacteriota bacterium]
MRTCLLNAERPPRVDEIAAASGVAAKSVRNTLEQRVWWAHRSGHDA